MRNAKDDITFEQVAAQVSYDPLTGRLTRVDGSPAQAEYTAPSGHVKCELKTGMYQAHRLAWLLFHGHWPNGLIDHKNGNPSDNRIQNLRVVSHAHNMQNQVRPHRNNASGFLGVSWDSKKKRWRAQITVTCGDKTKTVSIGRFATPKEAHEAYLNAKREHHPGCTI